MIWAVLVALGVPPWVSACGIRDFPLVASLALAKGGTVDVAAKREDHTGLLGPFGGSAADVGGDGDTR